MAIFRKYAKPGLALLFCLGVALLLQGWVPSVYDCNTVFPGLDRYSINDNSACDIKKGFTDSARCPTVTFTIQGGGIIKAPLEPEAISLLIQFFVTTPSGNVIMGDLREINYSPGSYNTLTANSTVIIQEACCGNYVIGYEFQIDSPTKIQIDHLLLNCQVSTNCKSSQENINVLPNTIVTPVYHTFANTGEMSGRIVAPFNFAADCWVDKQSCGCIRGCSE